MEPKTRRSALFLKGALVGVAYYVGALFGFALKFPSHSPSALWPPNSILLAALLLLPTRQWWVVFLGAFPPQTPVLEALENVVAATGASGVQYIADGKSSFDSS
jgi:hypothetical protein